MGRNWFTSASDGGTENRLKMEWVSIKWMGLNKMGLNKMGLNKMDGSQ